MLVNISDFAETRHEDRDTVNAYIRKHPEIQEYVIRQGKNTAIDTDSKGYALLDKKYPLPQMVQVIDDVESIKQLAKAREMIIQLQGRLDEASTKIAQAEAIEALLEDKKLQLEKAESRLEKTENRLSKTEEKLDKSSTELQDARKTIDELRAELEAERSKTWLQKLLKK